jgi:hypothetical protein
MRVMEVINEAKGAMRASDQQQPQAGGMVVALLTARAIVNASVKRH